MVINRCSRGYTLAISLVTNHGGSRAEVPLETKWGALSGCHDDIEKAFFVFTIFELYISVKIASSVVLSTRN